MVKPLKCRKPSMALPPVFHFFSSKGVSNFQTNRSGGKESEPKSKNALFILIYGFSLPPFLLV
jgi:hypothetical protein